MLDLFLATTCGEVSLIDKGSLKKKKEENFMISSKEVGGEVGQFKSQLIYILNSDMGERGRSHSKVGTICIIFLSFRNPSNVGLI